MCGFICSLLDYDTQLYIEPYGGGARILLNKKMHEVEIYNDASFALSTFFEVMTDANKTDQLIDKLLSIVPTEDLFAEMLSDRIGIEDSISVDIKTGAKKFIRSLYKKTNSVFYKQLYESVLEDDYEKTVGILRGIFNDISLLNMLSPSDELELYQWKEQIEAYWDIIKDTYIATKEQAGINFDEAWKENLLIPDQQDIGYKQYRDYKERYVKDCIQADAMSYECDTININRIGNSMDQIEIAKRIFVLYYSSRDGMAVAWSREKNENLQKYYKAVKNLSDVNRRMQDVTVLNVDAIDLIREYRCFSGCMMYLDPSYLNENEENLGKIYKVSYDKEEHEKLLTEITKTDTRAKIAISNYNVNLYQKYLSTWDSVFYHTYTGVGGKKNNRRDEVVWKNF